MALAAALAAVAALGDGDDNSGAAAAAAGAATSQSGATAAKAMQAACAALSGDDNAKDGGDAAMPPEAAPLRQLALAFTRDAEGADDAAAAAFQADTVAALTAQTSALDVLVSVARLRRWEEKQVGGLPAAESAALGAVAAAAAEALGAVMGAAGDGFRSALWAAVTAHEGDPDGEELARDLLDVIERAPKGRKVQVADTVLPALTALASSSPESADFCVERLAYTCTSVADVDASRTFFPVLCGLLPHANGYQPALGALARLIYIADDQLLHQGLRALASVAARGGVVPVQHVIEAGVTRRVVELLLHPSFDVQQPALDLMCAILKGDDLQRQIAINCSVLPCLLALLASPKLGIRRRTARAVAAAAAGTREQVQAIIDAGLVLPLLALRQTDIQAARYAELALFNLLIRASREQEQFLHQSGFLRAPLRWGEAVATLKADSAGHATFIHDFLRAISSVIPEGDDQDDQDDDDGDDGKEETFRSLCFRAMSSDAATAAPESAAAGSEDDAGTMCLAAGLRLRCSSTEENDPIARACEEFLLHGKGQRFRTGGATKSAAKSG